MSESLGWTRTEPDNGCVEFELHSWKYFGDFVQQVMLDYRHFVWRGQRCSDWKLEATLDRQLSSLEEADREDVIEAHLENFKMSVRGRRGTNPPSLATENDWWALGQHHGLLTPLLDWSASPFVAAFFAFARIGTPQTERRAVYALTSNVAKGTPSVDFVHPYSDENARLVNQSGLFTRAPKGTDIETFVSRKYPGESTTYRLIKVTIPDSDRDLCLRSLNRMNINHLSLFPDLYGASMYCNLDLHVDKY